MAGVPTVRIFRTPAQQLLHDINLYHLLSTPTSVDRDHLRRDYRPDPAMFPRAPVPETLQTRMLAQILAWQILVDDLARALGRSARQAALC